KAGAAHVPTSNTPETPEAALPPPKAGRMCLHGQRARGPAIRRFDVVVAARGDVVRGVRVEDRRQVLDLAAADAELELAAAVALDPVFLAVLVELEERAQAAGARRLDVDHLRHERERLDVVDRVDDRVPR